MCKYSFMLSTDPDSGKRPWKSHCSAVRSSVFYWTLCLSSESRRVERVRGEMWFSLKCWRDVEAFMCVVGFVTVPSLLRLLIQNTDWKPELCLSGPICITAVLSLNVHRSNVEENKMCSVLKWHLSLPIASRCLFNLELVQMINKAVLFLSRRNVFLTSPQQ